MSRHHDPLQAAQRAMNRREHFRQAREGRGDWALMFAALVFVVVMLVAQ